MCKSKIFGLKRSKIAFVDDDKELVTLYAEALIDAGGYDLASFTDPFAALEEVCENHSQYALVISDNRMPGMNGIELLTQLHEKDDQIKLLLISGFGNISNADLGHNYLQKPVRISLLLDMVNTIINAGKKTKRPHIMLEE